MRRLISISALATLALVSLSLLSPSLQAQMRGGGGRGFSGGGRGFASAPRAGSGFRAAPAFRPSPGFRGPVGRGGFAGSRSFGGHGFGGRSFGGRSFASSRHVGFNSRPFFNGHFRHFGHRPFFVNSCFGVFGCNPFFNTGLFFGSPFYPGYYPFYSGFSDYSYYPPPAAPAEVAYGNENNHDVELAMAVQRLSDQVEDLRDEQRGLHQVYPAPAAPGTSMSAVPPAASTIFVFHDGRRMIAKNYAITGQTLWIFDEHAAHKYLLSDLDRAATERTNSTNGVDLRLPEAAR